MITKNDTSVTLEKICNTLIITVLFLSLFTYA